MLSFLYVYSDHSILECYNLFSGVELSMRSFFVIWTGMICSRSLTYVHLGARECTLNWVGDRTHIILVSSCSLLFFPFSVYSEQRCIFFYVYIFTLIETANFSINNNNILNRVFKKASLSIIIQSHHS